MTFNSIEKGSDGTSVTIPDPMGAGSGEALAAPHPEPTPLSTDPSRHGVVRLGDRIFRGLAESSGVFIVALIAAIGIFLLWRAIPALARNEQNFFLYGGNWITTDTSAMQFGILDLLQVTVFVSVFALLLGVLWAFRGTAQRHTPTNERNDHHSTELAHAHGGTMHDQQGEH